MADLVEHDRAATAREKLTKSCEIQLLNHISHSFHGKAGEAGRLLKKDGQELDKKMKDHLRAGQPSCQLSWRGVKRADCVTGYA